MVHNDAVEVGDRCQRAVVKLLGAHLSDGGLQRPGGADVGNDRHPIAPQERALTGEGHAHVRHEADDDDVLMPGGIHPITEVSADEGVRCCLDDRRLTLHGCDQRVDLPDLGAHVVGGALSAVVDLSMSRRCPKIPGQFLR